MMMPQPRSFEEYGPARFQRMSIRTPSVDNDCVYHFHKSICAHNELRQPSGGKGKKKRSYQKCATTQPWCSALPGQIIRIRSVDTD